MRLEEGHDRVDRAASAAVNRAVPAASCQNLGGLRLRGSRDFRPAPERFGFPGGLSTYAPQFSLEGLLRIVVRPGRPVGPKGRSRGNTRGGQSLFSALDQREPTRAVCRLRLPSICTILYWLAGSWKTSRAA